METGDLFGPSFRKRLSVASYPKVPDEENCLVELRKLVGQHANQDMLVRHLRQTLGRVHWAVNGYFREMLAAPVPESGREDFAPGALMATMDPAPKSEDCKPRPGLRTASNKKSAATPDSGSCSSSVVLPLSALEEIFSFAGVQTVCAASMVCRYFHQAAKSNLVWQRLYKARWGEFSATPVQEADWQEEAPALVPLPNQLDSVFSIHGPIGLMIHGPVRGSLQPTVPARRRRPQRDSASGQPSTSAGDAARAQTDSAGTAGAAGREGLPVAASVGQSEERGGLGGGGSGCDQRDPTGSTREQSDGCKAAGAGAGLAENGAKRGEEEGKKAPASTSGQQKPVCWRTTYIQQHRAEQKMRCPCCERGVVSPVLYGFPSDQLMEGMRAGRLMLGGDYMMPTLPIWGCSYCPSRFDVFPFPPYPK